MKSMKERRLWYYPCNGCGKSRAQSHKKKNAKDGLCASCRKAEPTQRATLFDALNEPDGVVYGIPFKVVETPPGHPMHQPKRISLHMAAMMAERGIITIEQLEKAKTSDDGHLKGNFYLNKQKATV